MKNIVILGSTGSIGRQTVDVVLRHPELFRVSVIAAHRSDELVEEQIEKLRPEVAVLVDEEAAARLKSRYAGGTKILAGRQAFIEAASYPAAEIVVTSMMGAAGLEPTMAAIAAGKDIALANKETLVVAGEVVKKAAAEKGVSILPVDSEHCALFQCLQGEARNKVSRLLLTASGGPFRGKKAAELAGVTKAQCLAHPTWAMGRKITIDSASLVNKGLEVIEAHWLYDMPYEKIDVVVHPQSIVHSMVEYVDGAVMAQLGTTDMRLMIQYALTYPKRMETGLPKLDFKSLKSLTFEEPDMETFRGLSLAYQAGREGGLAPCVFNAANEIAVEAFLADRIKFLDIYAVIEDALEKRENKQHPSMEELLAEDAAVRVLAKEYIDKM
ncbi:1-deoxy-D-xylulose-5-phosphate reductoisomerase [Selenomonas sp. TAMA-11512]|uniref:1-deoxy-D-xylulose-5-phosphate reductoisomerase n=1 Tax=Selenomonas sp. TAMA-11512 TaxID=3095337 RepID=UPI00308D7B7D|nr:1-deoxy-D-xylulose-5-phosphate reductoisomerase [Selenomonas sp. TAMA-11512]